MSEQKPVLIELSKLELLSARYEQGIGSLSREIAQTEEVLARLKRDRDQTTGARAALLTLIKESKADDAAKAAKPTVPEAPVAV